MNHDDFTPVGLLLDEDEFDHLVSNWSLRSKLDDSLLDTIFKLTAGHVGGIVVLIDVIRASEVYRRLNNSDGHLTLERFWEDIPYARFITNITEGSTTFTRGLPQQVDLENPSIAKVLQTVLKLHSVNDQSFDADENLKEALNTCYHRGWLHSDRTIKGQCYNAYKKYEPCEWNLAWNSEIRYFFPSPLHQALVEGLLCSSRNASIPEENIQDFVVSVCRRMSPGNLDAARPIGAAYIQRPTEGRHGDEFYRACSDYAASSIITLSEFGSSEGRIDFFVPSKRWGIEILRDGDQMEVHNDRFASGVYGKWIDGGVMEDYIMLDFHRERPLVTHPEMSHLYHVVFEENGLMEIVDNMLQSVSGGIQLLS